MFEIVPEKPYSKLDLMWMNPKSRTSVIPFATSGSSGIGDSGKNIGELAKGATVDAGLRFKAKASADELKAWAEKYL